MSASLLNMTEPLVSIVIVVRNAATTIGAAIDSVLGQTYVNKQLILIDGASTDGTVEIIKRYQSAITVFISEKDTGIYDAMNKGIRSAGGEWIYFLGSDDVLNDPAVLRKIFDKNIGDEVEMIYGDVTIKSTNAVYGGSRNYNELIEKNINHQGIFYRKSLLVELGGYDLRYKILADYDLNLRIFRSRQNSTRYVKQIISIYNDKGGASNIVIDSAFFRDKLESFVNSEGISPQSPLLQQYYFYTGFCMLLAAEVKKGLLYCLRAFFSGKRKIFFFLIFWKFLLSRFGIGQRIKIV